jgi:hypothetical protein
VFRIAMRDADADAYDTQISGPASSARLEPPIRNLEMQLRQGTTAWLADLPDHPIFRAAEHEETLSGDAPNSATKAGSGATNSRRRTNKMCFRGPDMILAVGNELRIATFVDSKSPSGGSIRQYKVRSPECV